MSVLKIVRSVFALILCFSLLMTATACDAFGRDIFYYQRSASTVEGSLICGDLQYGVELLLEVWDGDTEQTFRAGKLTFTSPEELCGTAFEFSAGSVYAVSGDLRIPLSSGSLSSVNLLSCLFCLDRDSVKKIETEKTEDGKRTVIDVEDEHLSASVTLDGKSGLPTHIRAVCGGSELELLIENMTLIK